MRRFAIAVAGAAICVCCVLPSYDGSLPERGQGGDAANAGSSNGDAGRSSTTQATGGDNNNTAGSVGASGGTTPSGSKPVGGTTSTSGSNPGGAPAVGGEGGEPSGTQEVACPTNVVGHCAADSIYPTYQGYKLALVEDFPVPLNLNEDPIFTWSDGAVTDGQTGFREQNITFSDGKMMITAESDCAATTTNSSCYPSRTSYAEALNPYATATLPKLGIWSGELRSKSNNYRYGRYEVKLTAPVANPGNSEVDNMAGSFFATLFAFRTPRNVQWAEIDVQLEAFKHNSIATNVVSATGASGYPPDKASAADTAGPLDYSITQEHVYAFTWEQNKIEWFVDDKVVRSFIGTGQVPIPNSSAKIMMSLWVFSSNVFGDPKLNHYPFHSSYEYFRFYRSDNDAKYPCATPPACLDAADKTQSSQNNSKEVNYGL